MDERFPRIKKGIDCYRKMARIGRMDRYRNKVFRHGDQYVVVRGRSIEYERREARRKAQSSVSVTTR